MPIFFTNRNTGDETALVPAGGNATEAGVVPAGGNTEDGAVVPVASNAEGGAVVPVDGNVQGGAIVPADGNAEAGAVVPATGFHKVNYIDLEDNEVVEVEIVQDIDSVGGSWEQTHKEDANRPAPKGRPAYKTQKQRLRELEAAYKKAKAELDQEWAVYAKKKKALDKKRKKAAKKNDKLIAVEYTPADFTGDYPDIVEEKLMNVGFTEISFEPIKDVRAYNLELLDMVESVVVNSILYFKPEDLFQYDCPIVINYHAKSRLEIPFSPSQLKKMSIDEVEKALTDAGFCEITKTEVPRSGFGLLKKPGKIESFKVNEYPLAVEHQTAEFDEPIVITYYAK